MPEPWEPGPEEIHALIPQRAAGQEFSSTTTPTLEQVLQLTANIITDITTYVGEDIPEEDHPLARLTAAYGTAAEIERALYPEASRREGSIYEGLQATYIDFRQRLTTLVGDHAEAGTSSGGPQGSFPAPEYPVSNEIFHPIGGIRS